MDPMHPLVQALLGSWEWRFEILAILILLGVMYTLGWRRLRKQSSVRRLATWPRLIAYLSGLAILATALMSPIDALGGQLFFMHMIQHLLTIMIAAPLMLLANPFPFMLWALPSGARKQVARHFRRDAVLRLALAKIARPGVTWLIFITVYIGWHDSTAYNTALIYGWVHDIQHITFFLAALLYWWPVIGAAPRIQGRFPGWGKVAYLIGTVPPNMFIGVSIAFAGEVLYPYYLSVPRIWGLTVIQDQQLAGAIMWIPGSMMFIVGALIILAGMFGREQRPERTPRTWDNEATMIAPGLENRVVQNRWRRLHSGDGADHNMTDVSQHV